MKRKLAYLVLFYFSLSALGLAFHHHADGVPHDACPLCCHASHHSNLVIQDFQDFPQISLLSSNVSFISIENILNTSYLHYHPYLNRAPPA